MGNRKTVNLLFQYIFHFNCRWALTVVVVVLVILVGVFMFMTTKSMTAVTPESMLLVRILHLIAAGPVLANYLIELGLMGVAQNKTKQSLVYTDAKR
jgi:hypothetical protein